MDAVRFTISSTPFGQRFGGRGPRRDGPGGDGGRGPGRHRHGDPEAFDERGPGHHRHDGPDGFGEGGRGRHRHGGPDGHGFRHDHPGAFDERGPRNHRCAPVGEHGGPGDGEGFGPGGRGGRGPEGGRGRGRGPGGPGGRGRGRGPGGRGPGGPFGRPGDPELPGFLPPGARVGRGDIRAGILVLLLEGPMHGYQLISELHERSGGVWRPSPGSVYPTLKRLSAEELVESSEGRGPRKAFSLTDAGTEEATRLAAESTPWEALVDDDDRGALELRDLVVSVVDAARQVVRVADADQAADAKKVLVEARRRLYGILAQPAHGLPLRRVRTLLPDRLRTVVAAHGATID
ncbi:PadR family transcriptional regulator, partial [Patulibacter sp. NPDC049589]|uniref:PadR family transcriptional regulator n=1 Tax=Patulibacter sp. NPDC049589 TaxID=3154731 RepID=UPI0034389EE8